MQLAREALCYALCIGWLDDLCLGLFKFRNTDDVTLYLSYTLLKYLLSCYFLTLMVEGKQHDKQLVDESSDQLPKGSY